MILKGRRAGLATPPEAVQNAQQALESDDPAVLRNALRAMLIGR